ncbi:hypothetical protein SCLCIDRAFT_112948 [Scleroderma citrinum Foug A]|uniref:Uncharacterized protein n=1 Tax=Scleroderma citrinum Foug A TaxID=1036808 RepID=A0A0C3DXF7_9AGAM|nr:hypothetical protein SCLCIDRAFT_112948 [Scleroderma citrinum Foug A]
MSWRVTDNLRCYLNEARLPDMHCSPTAASEMGSLSSGLDVHPRRYRQLEVVHAIDSQLFRDMILDWTRNYVPSAPLDVDDEDEKTGERFTVPCKRFSVPSLPLGRVDNIERVSSCIDNFPLESIRRAIHLIYPGYRSWRFACCDESSAQPYFRRFSWTQYYLTESGKNKQVNQMLTMFSFSPWILSEEDLQNFILPQTFPQRQRARAPTSESERFPFEQQEWLWSKVWDQCFSNDCRWFVVSTYMHWVFGVFSADWTDAFVSPLYRHDSCSPTVLEVMAFWVISAMGSEGGWVPPEGRGGCELHIQLLSATVMDISVDIPKALAVAKYD